MKQLNRIRVIAILLLSISLAGCPKPPDDLDAYLRFQMDRAHIPGLSAVIVKNGQPVWSGVHGTADSSTGAPVREDTLFMLASISKTVTATAVMQLYERGLLALDEDVNHYLPFPVRNPWHPDSPITTRMLLTHTSSIHDNLRVSSEVYVDGDSPIALGDFLEDYLVPGGAYYRPANSFAPWAPGVQWKYSNFGMTLAGYVVEVISGMPFSDFCQENIFDPLGMAETGWFLRDLEGAMIARPHDYHCLGNEFTAIDHYGYPDYPDGQLRASARDYARFLAAFLGGGELDGVRILQLDTVMEMLSTPFPAANPDQAHGWYYMPQGGRALPGHTGGDRGVSTETFFDPEASTGVLIFTNASIPLGHRNVLAEIGDRLLEEAGRF